MEKLIINACPVCGSTHLKRVMTCTDFYASGEQFELCSCEDCGFTFTQGVPVEAEIGKYYETPDYISHTDTRNGRDEYHLPLCTFLYAGSQSASGSKRSTP